MRCTRCTPTTSWRTPTMFISSFIVIFIIIRISTPTTSIIRTRFIFPIFAFSIPFSIFTNINPCLVVICHTFLWTTIYLNKITMITCSPKILSISSFFFYPIIPIRVSRRTCYLPGSYINLPMVIPNIYSTFIIRTIIITIYPISIFNPFFFIWLFRTTISLPPTCKK